MSTNDITGDAIRSRIANDKFEEGYDRIFGRKERPFMQKTFPDNYDPETGRFKDENDSTDKR